MRLRVSGRPTLFDPECRAVGSLTRKDLLLLAILASDPHRLWDRSELAAMVWSESNLESARLSLRGALSSIRKVLPPNSILSIDRKSASPPTPSKSNPSRLAKPMSPNFSLVDGTIPGS
jgi:hypothetical protein